MQIFDSIAFMEMIEFVTCEIICEQSIQILSFWYSETFTVFSTVNLFVFVFTGLNVYYLRNSGPEIRFVSGPPSNNLRRRCLVSTWRCQKNTPPSLRTGFWDFGVNICSVGVHTMDGEFSDRTASTNSPRLWFSVRYHELNTNRRYREKSVIGRDARGQGLSPRGDVMAARCGFWRHAETRTNELRAKVRGTAARHESCGGGGVLIYNVSDVFTTTVRIYNIMWKRLVATRL